MSPSARHLVDRLRAVPDWLQDLVLAIAVSEADLVVVLASGTEQGPWGRMPAPVAAAAVVMISLPLVFRRRAPEIVIMLTGFGAGAAAALGVPIQPLAPIVALYSVAAYSELRETVISTAIFLAITTGLVVATESLALLYSNTLIVLGVAVVGRIVRAYRQQAVELEGRAHELEREREERARLAVQAERNRIARDMHDILAHSTSVMVVQAQGARRLVRNRPEQVESALDTIAATGRQTLGEVRRMLGLLRHETDVPTHPQPGVGDLDGLVEEFVSAGLPVQLRMSPNVPDELDASIGLSLYRIVQEALTNALKHSQAERVTVDVRRMHQRLEVEVLDDGGRARRRPGPRGGVGGVGAIRGLRETGGGYGLLGMRERATVVGGRLEAGHRPGGGFRVAAVFPLAGVDEPADTGTERVGGRG